MRFCCIVSHFMYNGLVTTFDVHYILLIYDDVCSFLHLCLTCVVSFLSLYTYFLYTTCLCFTLDALMNLV